MLTVIMAVGATSTFVSADTTPIDGEDARGSITVSGIESGATATAYRLMTVDFDYSSNQPKDPEFYWVDNDSLRKYVNGMSSGIVKSDGSVNMAQMNEIKDSSKNSEIFFDKIAAAIRSGDIKLAATKSITGNGTITDLEMGNYLVVIDGGNKVYRASAVNIVPTYTDGKWVIDNPSIEVKSSETNLTKQIITTAGTVSATNASIGDTVNFEITARVPVYPKNALNKTFKIGDKSATGLTIKTDTIKVYGDDKELDNTGSRYYKLEDTDSNDFTLEFDYEAIKDYTNIIVKYETVLNSKATIGGSGNANDAFLTYSNDPYASTDSPKESKAEAKVYTYGFDLTKVDKSNASKTLSGAEFTLYSDENLNNSIGFTGSDGSYIKDDGSQTGRVTTVKVDADGKLILKGLAAGTYYLKETKAPDGYNIQRDPFQLIVKADNDFTAINGTGTRFTNGLVTMNIQNSNGFSLPITGDMGTIIFVAGGIALVSLGAVLVIMARRRSKNTDAA